MSDPKFQMSGDIRNGIEMVTYRFVPQQRRPLLPARHQVEPES